MSMKPSIYWLFVFIPVTLVLEHAGKVPPPVIFFSAALAIVPIAALIVLSTEQLATRTGDAVGGLLNATFGNAPELIIALVALKAGYFDMVRASIIGAILANLLLATGVAFFLGGLRHHDQEYNAGAARLYSSMMLIAAISLAVPSAFSRFFSPEGTMPAGEDHSISGSRSCCSRPTVVSGVHAQDAPGFFQERQRQAGGVTSMKVPNGAWRGRSAVCWGRRCWRRG